MKAREPVWSERCDIYFCMPGHLLSGFKLLSAVPFGSFPKLHSLKNLPNKISPKCKCYNHICMKNETKVIFFILWKLWNYINGYKEIRWTGKADTFNRERGQVVKLWDLGVLKGVELPGTNTCKLGQRQAFEKTWFKSWATDCILNNRILTQSWFNEGETKGVNYKELG